MKGEIDSLKAKQIVLSLNYHKKLAFSVSLIPC